MNLIKILIFTILFCFAICIGDFLQHFQLIPIFNYELKLIDLMNLIATICIGLAIPLYFSKLLDDKKTVKAFLTDECKETLSEVLKLNEIICNQEIGSTLEIEKLNEIMFLLELSEMKLNNLIFFLTSAKLSQKIYNSDQFKNSFLIYWNDITGGNLMSIQFVFNDTFRTHVLESFYKLEKEIKVFVFKLGSS